MTRSRPDFGFTKRDVLQWLAGQEEEKIRTVLMSIGRDPDVEALELHGDPLELVNQLEGSRPSLESLVAAIDDALGIDEEALGQLVRGECEELFEVEPEELEVELDDDELDLGGDEDEA
ncbi:MAG: hypothetical protein R6X12_02575 [bacterium]